MSPNKQNSLLLILSVSGTAVGLRDAIKKRLTTWVKPISGSSCDMCSRSRRGEGGTWRRRYVDGRLTAVAARHDDGRRYDPRGRHGDGR